MRNLFDKQVRHVPQQYCPFGEKLKLARVAAGYKQEQIAGFMKKQRTTITNWELGTAIPKSNELLQLCVLYRVSPNELLEWDQEAVDEAWNDDMRGKDDN